MQKQNPNPATSMSVFRMNKTARTLLALFLATLCTNLTASAAVKVTPPAEKTEISAIANQPLDSTVEVEVKVKDISKPREGSKAPVRVTIADETGSITLIIWQDTFEVVQSQYDLSPGDSIRVRARVTEFREQRQLTLRNIRDLSILSKGGAAAAAPAPGGAAPDAVPAPARKATTPLESINNSMMGQEVTVQASITDIREPRSEKAPFVVTLSEGGSKLPMVFWSDIQTQIAQHLKVGNVVRVKAIVNEHRGTLQLKLRAAKDIEVVGSGGGDQSDAGQGEQSAGARPADGRAEIGDITEEWANRTVTVAGDIAASESIGKGQRVRLRDASGEIQVILWDSVLSRIPADELREGRAVSVTGQVKLYRGRVEVVPDSADAVKLQVN